ncbi:MAG: type II secretion system ATPase GspE [Deltaproteobacteria bacterium]|nr:type II secretion system ATPase GspE [Deltaproteobacteria bacterium]
MSEPRDNFIGEILVEHGVLRPEDLERIIAARAEKGGSFVDVLLASETVDEKRLWSTVATEMDMAFAEAIDVEKIESHLVADLPIVFAKSHRVLPIGEDPAGVHVACANPFDMAALDAVQTIVGRPVVPVVVPGEVILDAINKVYGRGEGDAELGEKEGAQEEELTDLIDVKDEAPIIRWVNSLFFEAVKHRASDIHIEPLDRDVAVRYRVDGVLQTAKRAKKAFLPSIISRVKILSKLNIAEKRLPQDGRIALKIAGKNIDVRVSSIPTSQGERVVMRLLDKESVLHDVSDLGFWPDHYALFHGLILRPHGIILVTGPTGSGKTTTLYAGLQQINTPDRNILTVEDPVEYDIEGIGQMHVNPKIDLTFSNGLRAFLRQDPDVIMVGEIRDRETAEIAIHASLTGHLVMSTIHTNDAPGALTRLVEMDIEPFLVASSIIGIQAQRLVRLLCPKCRELYEPEREQLVELGIDPDDPYKPSRKPASPLYTAGWEKLRPLVPLVPGKVRLHRAVGCDFCLGTGYYGRTGLYEMVMITDTIRTNILRNSDSNTIKQVAKADGMVNLREDGARKVLTGTTTVEEVLRVTHEDAG